MYKNRTNPIFAPLLFLIVFGISFSNSIQAQDQDGPAEMRVIEGSPKISSGDIIADRNDNRDINGNLTAGLRIKTDLTGLTFNSRNGILKSQRDPGSTLLYLSSNERMVEVFKEGYLPLQIVLSEHGINLEEGKVWELTLTGDKTTSLAPVRFNITPENSTLIINGQPNQITGTAFDTSLTTGDHFIQVRKPQYAFEADTINISSETVNNFTFNLDAINPIPITITSTPSGASVTVNDEPGSRGTTPITFREYPGDLKIRLTLNGYSSVEDEIDFTGEITEYNFNLQEYIGLLSVNLTPSEALLLIDGVIKNSTKDIRLTPGVYAIEARAPGYEAQRKNITIAQGDSLVEDIDLVQLTGNFFFSIKQEQANITLRRNNQIVEQWKGNNSFEDLPIGIYQLTAELNNFETKTRDVEIIRNSDQIVSLDLTQIDGRGSLTVDAVFRDAEVELKGPGFTRTYDELPLNLPSLPFGSYEIKIEKKGFDDVTKRIEINSLSQELTVVDEFEARGKGGALFRSLFIPGTGHGYLGKGGRGFLYFLGSAGAIGYTVKSYLDYEKHFDNYEKALQKYNTAQPGSNFEDLKQNYRDAYKDAENAQDGIVTGLTVLAAVKGLETLDLLLQRSNKKLLREAKVDFNARNNGISMRINF